VLEKTKEVGYDAVKSRSDILNADAVITTGKKPQTLSRIQHI